MPPLLNTLFHGVAFGVLLLPVACSGPGAEEPVAVPFFETRTPEVPTGGPLDISLTFSVSANAEFDEELGVFLHFLDDSGEFMWAVDHTPPVPTTEWVPGSTVRYTRTVLLPFYPYLGDADVHVGLYSMKNGTRLPLEGDQVGQRAYRVGEIRLMPPADGIDVLYTSGWYPPEQESAGVQWRWSEKVGILLFRNPRRDALVYLNLRGSDADVPPRNVTVTVGERVAARFKTSPGDLVQKIPLSESLLGDTDDVRLRLQVDRLFVPAAAPNSDNPDRRPLGVQLLRAILVSR